VTRSRLDKAERLAAAATLPGEKAAAEAAAERLRAKTLPEPYTAPSIESEVLATLFNLGYRLVLESESRLNGRLHARYVESDDARHHLVEHLKATTALGKLGSDAAAWFGRLTAGRKIMEPERHPSGLRSTEAPHTPIQPLSAGMASHVRTR